MGEDIPLVSIVIPVFNQRHAFLAAAVSSALVQKGASFEVVVSDNHSTNNLQLALHAIKDDRLRIVRPNDHLAMVQHFAFAATQARGEFFSFLSSDDLLEPDWMEKILPILIANPDAAFAFGEIAGVKHDDSSVEIFRCRQNAMASGIYSSKQLIPLLANFDKRAGWLVGDLIRMSSYRLVGGIIHKDIQYAGDHALAMKLLETGPAAYANVLVGRHRVWRRAQGKVDGKRSIRAVNDVQHLYDLLEELTVVRSNPLAFRDMLHRAKRRKAAVLVLSFVVGSPESEMDQASAFDLFNGVLKLDSSVTTKALVALASTRFSRRIMRGTVRFAKFAQSLYQHLGPAQTND